MRRPEPLVFILILGVFFYSSSLFKGFLQDDAYIFARYARHIADGHGFVFNPGEYTEGATSILWTLIAALAALLGAQLPLFLKYFSLYSSLLWVFAFYLVCRQWLQRPFGWVLPVLLFVTFPSFCLWSQAGLEVTFFGFLCTGGFYLVEAWHRKGKRTYFCLLCIISVLLILTRPEGIAVVLLFALYLLLYPYRENRALIYKGYLPVLCISVMGLFVFRYLYFHDVVPNTYYAKGAGGYYLWRLGLGKLHTFLLENYNIVFFSLTFPVFLIPGRIRVLMAMVPLWALYYIKSGGDILPEHRLLLPAVPFMLLGTFYLFSFLKNNYINTGAGHWIFSCCLWAGGLFLMGTHYRYYKQNLSSYTDVIPALERAHGAIGRYLNEHMGEDDSAILTDAGMTSLYAQDRHIVDWLGLCDKRVARIFYDTGYNEWAMSYCYNDIEKSRRKKECTDAMNAYFDELQPRYAVLNLYLKNTPEEVSGMMELYKGKCDTLTDFAISRISFDGYFGVFTQKNEARGYVPVMVKPYHPYFWMVLVERPANKKTLRGEGF